MDSAGRATVATEKPLPDVARELKVPLDALREAARTSGFIDGKRRENLESHPDRVFLSDPEVERLKTTLQQRPHEDRGRGRTLTSPSRPKLGGMSANRRNKDSPSIEIRTGRRVRKLAPPPPPPPAEKAEPVPEPAEEPKAPPPEPKAEPAPAVAEPEPAPADAEPAAEPAAAAEPAETPPEPERPAPPPKPAPKAAKGSPQPKAPAKAEPSSAKPPRQGGAKRDKDARAGDGRSRPGRKARKDTLTISPDAKRRFPGLGRPRPRIDPDRPRKHGFTKPVEHVARKIEVPESIPLVTLAQRLAVKAPQIVSRLYSQGQEVTVQAILDQDTAALMVEEFGHDAVITKEPEINTDLPENLETGARPPVVTVMGHVDHGKTSLLDRIRKTSVAAGESGGITQHVGVYRADTPKGPVLFMDTPGHELFSEMRARGAKVTDIVVLVVAADDGVMPQTKEAVSHARAAEVPVIVAVNKIDKAGADPERIEKELGEVGVTPEKWGGDSQFVQVSATEGTGIDSLLDSIVAQAEILELSAPVNVPAQGVVVESYTDKGRGHLSTVIVQRGVLRPGDIVVCDTEYGRVRGLADENGRPLKSCDPSTPAVVQGLSGLPRNGSDFHVVDSDRRAREIVQSRRNKARDQRMAASFSVMTDDLSALLLSEEKKSLNVIVKADVAGTLEAITDALGQFSDEEAEVRIVHAGIGGVTTSDVNLAHASSARVVAFNVRPDGKARKLAEERQVEVGCYTVIYEAIDDLRRSLSEMLSPVIDERVTGSCKVLEIFRVSKAGNIAGCRVEEGAARAGSRVRVIRDGSPVYTGEVSSLKHFKDDVPEVRAGLECGIGMRKFNDFKVGDVLELFEVTERQRELAVSRA